MTTYRRVEVWVPEDGLGDYVADMGAAPVAQPAARRIARSNVGVERDTTGATLAPYAISAAPTSEVCRRRVWVERVGVGRWPRPCVCDAETDDLEAALAKVPDDHPSWTRS
jgi:hypothetical protein